MMFPLSTAPQGAPHLHTLSDARTVLHAVQRDTADWLESSARIVPDRVVREGCLTLPARRREPARASVPEAVGPHLARGLVADGDTFFAVDVTPEALNQAFQASWDDVCTFRTMPLLDVRLLHESDRNRGYMDLVRELSGGGALSAGDFAHVMQRRLMQQHYTVVVDSGAGIIATASLLIECKFSHDGGLAGHIEDVIVDASFRGCAVGLALVNTLKDVSNKLGLYKCTLDCTDENMAFYEKCGFEPAEVMMRFKPGGAQRAPEHASRAGASGAAQ